jgi:hypothetical protein
MRSAEWRASSPSASNLMQTYRWAKAKKDQMRLTDAVAAEAPANRPNTEPAIRPVPPG